MPKSTFFRVATAGATTDGREIQPDWIDQMAASYNPAKYGARVNMEHVRGLLPDSPFKMYGDVIALKAETIDGKRVLRAQIDPTPELVALNKARQKLYTSIEINPDFAGSGQAYLVGLAVTDSPASLGTEMLQFAAGLGDKSPFAARKLHPDNLFTAAEAFSLELEEEVSDGPLKAVIDKLTNLFKSGQHSSHLQEADTAKALEAVADHLKTLDANVKEIGSVSQTVATLQQTLQATQKQLETTTAAFNTFKAQVESTPNNFRRPPASGGQGSQIKTDC